MYIQVYEHNTSHKKFSEEKQACVGMEPLKNQPN